MLSYIPETPVAPNPHVIEVRKADEDVAESSESPDETDGTTRKRRQKVTSHWIEKFKSFDCVSCHVQGATKPFSDCPGISTIGFW